MHVSKRQRRITGTDGKDKTAVMGMLERGGQVRTIVVPNRKRTALQAEVRKHVEAGAALYTDSLPSYSGLAQEYAHAVVDHAVEYVNGRVHTNGLENFWSLLKRGIAGTYVSVEPFHLFCYLDEQSFRFNNRKDNDAPPLQSRYLSDRRQTANPCATHWQGWEKRQHANPYRLKRGRRAQS